MNKGRDRLFAAGLALLLQAGFVLLFVAYQQSANWPGTAVEEITVILPPVQKAPPQILPAPRNIALPAVSVPPVPQISLLPELPETEVPSEQNVQNLGRTLFACEPENYGSLSEEDRARCPNLAAGVAIEEFPDLMGSRSYVEDNARWANALAHEPSPLMLPCLAGLDILCVLRNIVGLADGSTLDPESPLRDPEQWPTYVDANQFTSINLNERENEWNAWDKAHAPRP